MLDLDRRDPDALAVVDETGRTLTYRQLRALSGDLTVPVGGRCLCFCLCANTVGSLCGYLGMMERGAVPLLLDGSIRRELLDGLLDTYHPAFLWLPADRAGEFPGFEEAARREGYVLLRTGLPPYPLHGDLALLLTTSGSTGSPKLVRQSRRNIESNARSIAEYLGLDATERPITTLPMSYTYGLSILHSHLLAGATLLLTAKGLPQREFWEFFAAQKATSFGGVPYTYEMLRRLRFTQMDLPSLRSMTQAGGKLPVGLHRLFGEWAASKGVRFFIMYGQAEATARMGYLPPALCLEKCGGMGVAIPGGTFGLRDADGGEITQAETVGELVYWGDNVTLGYAEQGADLALGDERRGRLDTGDMARRDADGCYYIVGRKKRFVKLFGNRVNLDECEQLLKRRFDGIDCACAGRDDRMEIFLENAALAGEARRFLAETTGLHFSAFAVRIIGEIPKNEAGKTLYTALPPPEERA